MAQQRLHNWLVFIGDYEAEYVAELTKLLETRFAKNYKVGKSGKKLVDFHYEPVEALQRLIGKSDDTKSIGGAPQLAKVYPYGSNLPIVVRTEAAKHYLLGRQLLQWEKTEYPILDLTQGKPKLLYPKEHIPTPGKV